MTGCKSPCVFEMNCGVVTVSHDVALHVSGTLRYMLSPVRPSVHLSVTWVDQSKTVEVKITQPSPQSSPIDSSFLMLNFIAKFQREDREWGRQIREGYEKYAIFSQ